MAISLERLERQDGTVRPGSRSSDETETESWGDEVGFICGRFGSFVGDEWEVNDDISAEPFTSESFGSMTGA